MNKKVKAFPFLIVFLLHSEVYIALNFNCLYETFSTLPNLFLQCLAFSYFYQKLLSLLGANFIIKAFKKPFEALQRSVKIKI